MRFLSVCSGIEAASVAWNPLGWEAVGFSEVEPFPCAVLAHHYPDVPNHGSLTEWENWIDDVPAFDVLAGGTPCQGFSVAGRRGGLDDPRSQLAFDFLGIARSRQPRWVFWENVPGVLSSGGGRDFGAFFGELGKCGYGFAYRVLDAQYFGLAQRRKRVFVVGYLGDWRPAAAVLLEPESLRRDIAPSREAGEGTAAEPAKSLRGRSNASHREDSDNYVAATLRANGGQGSRQDKQPMVAVAQPLLANNGGGGINSNRNTTFVAHSLRAEGHDASEDGTGRGVPLTAWALQERDAKGPDSDTKDGHLIPVAFAQNQRGELRESEISTQLTTGGGKPGEGYPAVRSNMAVRRLTPTECARLQGFPDDYLDITYRGKPAADGPRYKALGNSWAVPVVRWIGKRMQQVTVRAA